MFDITAAEIEKRLAEGPGEVIAWRSTGRYRLVKRPVASSKPHDPVFPMEFVLQQLMSAIYADSNWIREEWHDEPTIEFDHDGKEVQPKG
jgi:hypothetical protein